MEKQRTQTSLPRRAARHLALVFLFASLSNAGRVAASPSLRQESSGPAPSPSVDPTQETGEQDTEKETGATEQDPTSKENEVAPSVEDTPEVSPRLPNTIDPMGGPSGQEQEMIDLFHEVERKLVEIDLDLADAGAGDLPLEEVQSAGLEDFLRTTLAKSTEVQDDIGRILQLAQAMGQGSGSGQGGGGQPQPSGGESPLDQARDKGPQGRENTPDAPDPSGEKQEQDGGDPDGPPKTGGEEPGKQDPKGDPKDPSNRGGKDPNSPPGSSHRGQDDAEPWGLLPERAREVFQNPGSRDLPVQYRDWIDTYYRRLSRSGSEPR